MISHRDPNLPLILAPAGNKAGFLAALAAGAEAVYCGLKQLSARREAKNFTFEELAGLTDLAHSRGSRVFVTINTLIKPDELNQAGKMLDDLNRRIHPDALIIQDPAVIELARQTGFSGELHLSTLANCGFGAALSLISRIRGVTRVVLPRELNIDEIKQLADACPENIGLEVFVHGALCYGVSGRCYWSSFLGGKSGLRGRCVQPCRRLYRQESDSKRYFSCQDLSLDVLVKVLLSVPSIKGWKIEGRKKGPHYVYYTVRAYKMLRDHPQDPLARKEALTLLSLALGRTGTHYGFLSQRPSNPIQVEGQTGSGLLLGKVSQGGDQSYLDLKQDLLAGDVLRIGYEDESGHATLKIGRNIITGSRFFLPSSGQSKTQQGAPVFLIDRREPDLTEKITRLEQQLKPSKNREWPSSPFKALLPRVRINRLPSIDQKVGRLIPSHDRNREEIGVWLSEKTELTGLSKSNIWWWLSPIIWPAEEAQYQSLLKQLLQKGSRHFVLNAPWQIALFRNPQRLTLWAGPFCNLSNPLSIQQLKSYGFSGAIVSPELGQEDYLSLPRQSPLPLGIVLSGLWPLCLARILSDRLKADRPFQSPKGEMAWAVRRDSNYWVYPNWEINLTAYRKELEQAGYQRFVRLRETVPRSVKIKERPGTWNWKIGLP
ncbi:MAG: U32 family peptidase [Deltaproteobacteria bacterium]|nr:U32 family peptidase [Deltaproteobacteria bacterium]